MLKTTLPALAAGWFSLAAAAHAQRYPTVDQTAATVVQTYQTSSCRQPAAERAHRPTGQRAVIEERAVQLPHANPAVSEEFISRVAAPIANQLFACGLSP